MSRKCNKNETKARRLGAVYIIYISNNLIVEKRNKN